MKKVTVVMMLLLGQSAFAAAVSSQVICADDSQYNRGLGTTYGGHQQAVRQLNDQLNSLQDASQVSAPSMAEVEGVNKQKKIVICVTITK